MACQFRIAASIHLRKGSAESLHAGRPMHLKRPLVSQQKQQHPSYEYEELQQKQKHNLEHVTVAAVTAGVVASLQQCSRLLHGLACRISNWPGATISNFCTSFATRRPCLSYGRSRFLGTNKPYLGCLTNCGSRGRAGRMCGRAGPGGVCWKARGVGRP